MKKLFNSLTPKKCRILSIAAAIFGDILIFSYIYHKFTTGFELFKSLMKIALEKNNISFSAVDHNFLMEQFELTCLMIASAIIILAIFHLVIYILHYYDKAFSRFYLFLYSGVAILGCGMMALSSIWGDPIMGILFLLQTLFYLFIFLGLRHFTPEK